MIGRLRVLVFFVLTLFIFPLVSHAALLSVTPAVIDGKGKAREILRYTITIQNTTDHLISIYPWVADVDKNLGAWEGEELRDGRGGDRKTSLSRWIEVTHGVIDLLPGDKREVPVLVQINLNAVPGLYHAVIHFSEGPNRKEAEANTENTFDTMVNMEVLEDKNVRLQLGGFLADKNFFIGDKATFSYSVENIGNRGVAPDGKIRIFDRRGQEIADISANDTRKKIEPTEKAQLGAVWLAQGEFGRYKAMLDLEYGDRGTIQDTVFFWVLPWGRIISYFLTLATVTIIIALLLHSRMASRPRFAGVEEETPLEERVRQHKERERRIPEREEIKHSRTSRGTQAPVTLTHASERLTYSGHRITLAPPPKPRIDPEHIVNLKRSS